ncbi:MBL fold metallo-hydrolase [Accumulibacter sp.]|uniref:MBL fold metallo-hydrolase n=1 Tax=Accumulibacter sp. TaxID=2053492 RepID=UPI001AC5F368|nr:MBL fold metallo-hydrolase [Accumulibacter sp.]MBN8518435.1 MBL fold metallo-hydrolase [Accumulibacter sp.]MCM8581230.1 MBL fold metallo-hydrolase [Accumulibacter sp.]MCM8621141.1 MBL fold metallo-hydrolase [Accumulibacter sp.]
MGPRILAIAPEISQVGGPGLTHGNDAAVYLVHFGELAALVDAGCGRATDRLLQNIEAAGVVPEQIRHLLLTHCHYDHSGGAAGLRRRFGWPVALHALEAPYLESGDDRVSAAAWYGEHLAACPVDVRLADGERFFLGQRSLQALHLPGHSPGSVAYLVESDGRRVVFAQDVHGPLHPDLLSKRSDYQASLRKLLALQADILCEGHYGVFVGRAAVAAFIERFVED